MTRDESAAGTDATRRVLTGLHAFGPHFTVAVADSPPDGGWQPVARLYDAGGAALGGLLDTTAQRLGTGDRRVAGSILHQGYCARLWSVTLGAAALGGLVPELTAEALYWRTTAASLVELLTVVPDGTHLPAHGDHDAAAELVRAVALDHHAAKLAAAIRAATGLSDQVLSGNAASSLVGTLRVLTGTAPDQPARGIVSALLVQRALRDTGSAELASPDPWFRRASCCLYYRVAGGGLCGDCVLNSSPG